MQLKPRKLHRTLQQLEALLAGKDLKLTAQLYVSDYQQKCSVTRQAAIDTVYDLFAAVFEESSSPTD